MSGGAYDYFYSKVNDVISEMEQIQHEYPQDYRTRVMKISVLYSELMYALEWADSGDTGPEDINKALDEFMQKVREL